MKYLSVIPVLVALSGCATLQDAFRPAALTTDAVSATGDDGVRPQSRPDALDTTPPPPPPINARTVEDFDTTTAEDRAEAVAAPEPEEAASERSLGTTVASLGSPTDPGIWLKTPLVSEIVQGRVVYPANGKSVNVELRPSGGEPGSGSQISLAAMRLLEAPLTGLPELTVYRN